MEQQAMFQAVEAFRSPSRNKQHKTSNLPSGMLTVIKVAAGDEKLLAENAEVFQLAPEQIQEAAKHFLLKALLNPESRGLRLLGLNEGASETEIKDHKRWLLKWLHPDRNPSTWEQALFHKVKAVKTDLNEIPRSMVVAKLDERFSRKHQHRRMWAQVESRRKDTSVRRILLRLSGPILVSTMFAAAIVWIYSARNTLHHEPFSFLVKLVN
jgi:hypothetical protein